MKEEVKVVGNIQNQAVIDIDTYYELRKENENLKTRAIQLEKGEILRLQDTIKELKIGLLAVLTQSRGGLEAIPPYEVTTEGTRLLLRVDRNIITKFNDVKVTIR